MTTYFYFLFIIKEVNGFYSSFVSVLNNLYTDNLDRTG